MDKPYYIVKVNVKLAYLKSVFIHPDNNTYPMFSAIVQETTVDFMSKCDYDQIDVKVKNMQVFDNTAYPETLDPIK